MRSDMGRSGRAIEKLESGLHERQRFAKRIVAELNRISRHLDVRAIASPVTLSSMEARGV